MCNLLNWFKRKPAPLPELPYKVEPLPLNLPAPRDIIKDALAYDDGGFLIPCKGGKIITGVAVTKSMLPTFDAQHNLLCTTEFDRSALVVGDIVIYSLDGGDGICHRIHAISTLDGVPAFSFKGDNNLAPDEGWHGPEVVKSLVVGIIY